MTIIVIIIQSDSGILLYVVYLVVIDKYHLTTFRHRGH